MINFTKLIESEKTARDFIEDAVTSDIAIERPNQSPDRSYEDDEIMNKSHILGFPESKEHYSILENQMIAFENIFKESLLEFESNKQDVINRLENAEWDTDTKEFYKSFKKAKHPEMLTDYSLSDFSKMKTFKLKDYNIGFALKKFQNKGYSEIVAVHNAEPNIGGIGQALMKAIVKEGGLYLDHFDGFLSNLYDKAGFVEYHRLKFDIQYSTQSFVDKYGKKDVIYRKYKTAPTPKIDY